MTTTAPTTPTPPTADPLAEGSSDILARIATLGRAALADFSRIELRDAADQLAASKARLLECEEFTPEAFLELEDKEAMIRAVIGFRGAMSICGLTADAAGSVPVDALQSDVWDWIQATFAPVNRPRCFVLKAREELDELAESLDPEEAADVVIALMAFCGCQGVSLGELIANKMRVNRARRWVQDADGVAFHTADAAGEEAGE